MFLFLQQTNLLLVVLVFLASLALLSKATDILVGNAVKLAVLWGLSQVVIGATVISLGTTLPELSSSVIATLQNGEGFALGNAVGSIITNTSLVLGLGALFGAIPVRKESSKKMSILILAVLALLLPAYFLNILSETAILPQWVGFLFLLAVPLYIFILTRDKESSALESGGSVPPAEQKGDWKSGFLIVVRIAISAAAVALGASALVASAEVMAIRAGIPNSVIASTIVAFGTSVPEISTTIVSAKKGHGGLAIGNVMGANVLNILLVLGASVSVSSGGMMLPQSFFLVQFPVLAVILSIFAYFVYNEKKREITRKEGIFLIALYFLYLAGNAAQTV